MKRKIVFRVDGNSTIGLGHIIRSLSLALILKNDFSVHFAVCDTPSNIREIIRSYGFRFHVLKEENDFLSNLERKVIVILDGYQFDTGYQIKVKEKGCYLVCIDDLHDKYFVADLVINHAPGVAKEKYSADETTSFLLGTDFTLLRPLFLKQATESRIVCEQVECVFICFGGSDPKDFTSRILEMVLKFPTIKKVIVITGPAYSRQSALLNSASSRASRVHYYHDVNEQMLVECFRDAQLAIVPASGILFESIACKIPTVSGYYTLNQFDIYQGFLNLGVIYDAGDFHPLRLKDALQYALSGGGASIIEKQAKCIDGLSPMRYLNIFQSLGE